jgi:hypothetical protein
MANSRESGKVVARVILIQVAIAIGLILWLKLGIPRLQKERNAEAAAQLEGRIHDFIQSTIVEDSGHELPVPGASAQGYSHPQHLHNTPSTEEVKQALGPADGYTSDIRGGVHIIWTGAEHKLEASFNNGRLYCLRVEDLHTGHGTLVFESSQDWRPF